MCDQGEFSYGLGTFVSYNYIRCDQDHMLSIELTSIESTSLITSWKVLLT